MTAVSRFGPARPRHPFAHAALIGSTPGVVPGGLLAIRALDQVLRPMLACILVLARSHLIA